MAQPRRVLMLTHRLPYPPDRGDRIRSYHLLKLLSEHFDLAIACPSDDPVWLQHHQLLNTMAKRVAIYPTSGRITRWRGAAAFFTGAAITPSSYFRRGLADAIVQWQETKPFDAVLTFCTGMIKYARIITGKDPARAPVRHVLDLVDVDSLKWGTYADSSWPPMKWVYRAESRRLRKIEAGAFDHFDAITVVSQNEAAAYRQSVGEHPGLTVVSNGVNLEYFAPEADAAGSKTIVFVGVLNYRPNTEGIIWFVKEVMPRLREKVADVNLRIIGRHPPASVTALGQQPGVEVAGSVPDVRPHIRDASVVIAPLLIARGVQNKVLEAMSSRRAVVCSPGAAQGLEAVDGEHLVVAQNPGQWVDHISALMTDTEKRNRIAAAARRYVEEKHSWERCLAPMVKLLGGG